MSGGVNVGGYKKDHVDFAFDTKGTALVITWDTFTEDIVHRH